MQSTPENRWRLSISVSPRQTGIERQGITVIGKVRLIISVITLTNITRSVVVVVVVVAVVVVVVPRGLVIPEELNHLPTINQVQLQIPPLSITWFFSPDPLGCEFSVPATSHYYMLPLTFATTVFVFFSFLLTEASSLASSTSLRTVSNKYKVFLRQIS